MCAMRCASIESFRKQNNELDWCFGPEQNKEPKYRKNEKRTDAFVQKPPVGFMVWFLWRPLLPIENTFE